MFLGVIVSAQTYDISDFTGCVIPIISDIKAKTDSTHLKTLKLNFWAQFETGISERTSERVTCFAETIIRTDRHVG